jgi:hypothetical protein
MEWCAMNQLWTKHHQQNSVSEFGLGEFNE